MRHNCPRWASDGRIRSIYLRFCKVDFILNVLYRQNWAKDLISRSIQKSYRGISSFHIYPSVSAEYGIHSKVCSCHKHYPHTWSFLIYSSPLSVTLPIYGLTCSIGRSIILSCQPWQWVLRYWLQLISLSCHSTPCHLIGWILDCMILVLFSIR